MSRAALPGGLRGRLLLALRAHERGHARGRRRGRARPAAAAAARPERDEPARRRCSPPRPRFETALAARSKRRPRDRAQLPAARRAVATRPTAACSSPTRARRRERLGVAAGFLDRLGERRRRRAGATLAGASPRSAHAGDGDRRQRRRPRDRRAALPRAASVAGVVVAQRRLTEVGNAVDEVRNALLAAAAVGLAVAVALGARCSPARCCAGSAACARPRCGSRAEGPDVPMPRDTGRDEVGDLARALARMQEELRRQEAARRAFVATASHELRTPLTMLQGTMELLDGGPRDGGSTSPTPRARSPPRGASCCGLSTLAERAARPLAARRRGRRCARSRSSSASSRAPSRPSSGCAPASATSAIEVVPPDGPCWGRGDPDAVARVVRILIDNALRYGAAGRADPRDHRVRGDRDASRSPTAARACRPRSASASSSASTAARAARLRGRLRPRPGDRPRAGRAHGRHARRSRTRDGGGTRFTLALPRSRGRRLGTEAGAAAGAG